VLPPPRHCGPLTERCVEGADPGVDAYLAADGYAGSRRAWKKRDLSELLAAVEASGLQTRGRWRGRVADEWRRVVAAGDAPRHVVCDAGLPGSGARADRMLVERAPHQVLDGLLVAARALGARSVHVCVASDHEAGERALATAVAEASGQGLVGRRVFGTRSTVEVKVVRPAVFASCGEGTALLEALEGRASRPRPRPPAASERGLEGRPTWVVDAETCAHLAAVAAHGPDRFREHGDVESPGTLLFDVSGAIERPGLYELPLGTRLGELLFEKAGGVARGRKVGAVLPDAPGCPALTPGQVDVPLLDAALRAHGGTLGRGRVFVIDDRTCAVAAAEAIAARLRTGACGHAVHCREGASWIHALLRAMAEGAATRADLAWLESLCEEVRSDHHCGYADAVGVPVGSLLALFRHDFEAHLHGEGCGRDREVAFA